VYEVLDGHDCPLRLYFPERSRFTQLAGKKVHVAMVEHGELAPPFRAK
jgi:hypothetical protein